MNFKIAIFLLFAGMIFQSCKKHKADDYAGTYIGMIRDKKISMFLKTGNNQTITGTIFDRANNFSVAGSVKHGKFLGQAKDTLINALFEVEGYIKKDTLVFLMSMVRPQKSPPLPVKFQKVFISGMEAPPSDMVVKDSTPTKKAPTNVNKGNTAAERHDAKVMGLWEVTNYSKGNVSSIISGNKYLFFNVNGSISYLDGELKPIKDKEWFTDDGQLVFITTKIGEFPEKLGKYTVDGKTMTIKGRNGSKISMSKKE